MTTLEKLEKLVKEHGQVELWRRYDGYQADAIFAARMKYAGKNSGKGPSLEAAVVDLLANMGAL